MTKDQAIQMINAALASLRVTRQEHEALILALKVIVGEPDNKKTDGGKP